VSSNLHNAVTKGQLYCTGYRYVITNWKKTATATKILKEMHESGQIEGRVSGKQIVYHTIQA